MTSPDATIDGVVYHNLTRFMEMNHLPQLKLREWKKAYKFTTPLVRIKTNVSEVYCTTAQLFKFGAFCDVYIEDDEFIFVSDVAQLVYTLTNCNPVVKVEVLGITPYHYKEDRKLRDSWFKGISDRLTVSSDIDTTKAMDALIVLYCGMGNPENWE